MKKTAIVISALLSMALSAAAADFATPKDAEALVTKLGKALLTNKEATLKEVAAKDPKWVHGDLYPYVRGAPSWQVIAHGQNAKLIGKDLSNLEDADGKQFAKESIQNTNANGKSWTDYKWMDPVTKKVTPKSTYCEKIADMQVCAGVYKR